MHIENKANMPWQQSVFPNFTKQMYKGNLPCGKGHKYIVEETGQTVDSDRWDTGFGGGQTLNGELMNCQFNLNSKVCIYIVGNTMTIIDIRYSGKWDVWRWSNDENFYPNGKYEHWLQEDRIETYLNATIDDCLFWNIVQKRAKEIYNKRGM